MCHQPPDTKGEDGSGEEEDDNGDGGDQEAEDTLLSPSRGNRAMTSMNEWGPSAPPCDVTLCYVQNETICAYISNVR
jgi:hypothetical protein